MKKPWLPFYFGLAAALFAGPEDARNSGRAQRPTGRVLEADMTVDIRPAPGVLRVDARLVVPRIFLDGDRLEFSLNPGFRVDRISDASGRPLPHVRDGMGVTVRLGEAAGPEGAGIRLEYSGRPDSETASYFGPEGCHAGWLSGWYPFLDGLEGLRGRIRYLVPRGWAAASQGRLRRRSSLDAGEECLFELQTPVYPSFAAAPYQVTSRTIDGREFSAYLLSGGKEKADFHLQKAAPILAALEKEFGPYPYESFGLVELPLVRSTRSGGGSEQGLVFLPSPSVPDDEFNVPVVAHEIGHLWWGNWVIGDGIVMSEGLAQTAFYLAAERLFGEDLMRKYQRYGSTDHFSSLILYLARFSDPARPEPLITTSRYEMDDYFVLQGKAPMVFLMLRDLIGREAFARGLRNAAAKYPHARMTMGQLRAEWEAAAERDLGGFFEQWVDQAGIPSLELTWSAERDGQAWAARGEIRQSGLRLFRMPIEIEIRTASGSSRQTVLLDRAATPFRAPAAARPEAVILDPGMKSLWRDASVKSRALFVESIIARRDPEKSAALLEELAGRAPDDILARAWLAFNETRFRRPGRQARSHLEYIVAHADPRGEYEVYFIQACFELAKILDDAGERERAVALYRRTLDLDRAGRYLRRAAANLKTPFRFPD